MDNKSDTGKEKNSTKTQKGVDTRKYEEFLQSHPKGHFMQSPQWAEVKSFWKNEIDVEDGTGIRAIIVHRRYRYCRIP